MAHQDKEVERKLVIPDEATLVRIREDARRGAFPHGSGLEGPLVRYDLYHDTEDLVLLKSGMSFRTGLKSDTVGRITFKRPTAREDTRHEFEERMLPEHFDAALLGKRPSRPVSELRRAIGQAPIALKLRVAKYFWATNGNGWSCVFGYVTFMRGDRQTEVLDLEIEAEEDGDSALIGGIADAVRKKYGLKEDPRPKYQVGMEAVG